MSNKREVWKFSAPAPGARIDVQMPRGARVSHFALQGDAGKFWAVVDPEASAESRTFVTVGTGFATTLEEGREAFHRGTVHVGPFVWHLLELVRL
jgi:hypothetical protein